MLFERFLNRLLTSFTNISLQNVIWLKYPFNLKLIIKKSANYLNYWNEKPSHGSNGILNFASILLNFPILKSRYSISNIRGIFFSLYCSVTSWFDVAELLSRIFFHFANTLKGKYFLIFYKCNWQYSKRNIMSEKGKNADWKFIFAHHAETFYFAIRKIINMAVKWLVKPLWNMAHSQVL